MPQTTAYTIHFRSYNRTTRRMSGRQVRHMTARSRFGALRQWWRVQRQWQPLVEVLACEAAGPFDEEMPWLWNQDEDTAD